MIAPTTRKRLPRRLAPFAALPLLLAMVAGCAGNPPVRAGIAGEPLPMGSAITLIGAPADEVPLAAKVRQAVTDALAERGHRITDNAPAQLDIGLTDRPARTGLAIIEGEELSPAKRRRLLQRCDLRTHRLVLTHYGAGSAVPITRAWADIHQCRGKLDGSIARLVREAVTALADGTGESASATSLAAGEAPFSYLQAPPAAQ